MKEKFMKKIVEQYFKAYNEFNLNGMIENIHNDLIFKTIVNGEITYELNGKYAFKEQIKQAFAIFKNKIIQHEKVRD